MASRDSEDDLGLLMFQAALPCETSAKKVTASPGAAAAPEYRPGTHGRRKSSAEIVSNDNNDDDDDDADDADADLQVGT